MTLKSKIYIGIIAFSLAVIVAVVSARRIQSVWFSEPADTKEETALENDAVYYPFSDQIEESEAANIEQMPNRMMISVDGDEAYVPEKEIQKPFFSGQIDLPALAKEQSEYIREHGDAGVVKPGNDEFKNNEEFEMNFEQYEQDPVVKKFISDMQKAMGSDMKDHQLSQQEMMEKILKNPQMQKILLEYSKNPKIMQIADDMIKGAQAAQKQNTQESGKVNKN